MIDLLYCVKNRREFTKKTLELLGRHTDWSLVSSFSMYDDDSVDGAQELLWEVQNKLANTMPRLNVSVTHGGFGGPVAIMNAFLEWRKPADLWAKIDNDVALPAGWLNACVDVLNRSPELDLLGIEAMGGLGTPVQRVPGEFRDYEPARYIGGIGLFRARGFAENRPQPNQTFFGFTAWQEQHPTAKIGWLKPPLPVVLLDRVPEAPWNELTDVYIAKGWARRWPPYEIAERSKWGWVNDARPKT